ncbi:MAG TPA: GNAT family protein [Gaiellaceae bacterium]
MAELRSERLLLRPATKEDVEAIARILAEPAVARWWGAYDAGRVHEDLPGSYAIVIDGTVQGWLLVSEETDPDYRHVAFDISLSTAVQGQGYGPEALQAAIRHFAALGHHRFTIDPAAHNDRAIRAYSSVGFRPVGVLREYERGSDGTWHDGLLMDLLAAELEP